MRKSAGFTLAELLIVITIILIITGAIIPSFVGYIQNQTLKQAQENFKSDLRSVQNRALTGSLSDQTIGGNPVKYWAIKGTYLTSTYDFFIDSQNTTCPGSFAAGQKQGTSTIPSGVVMYGTSGVSYCIFFAMSDGTINTIPVVTFFPLFKTGGSTATDCRRIMFNSNGLTYSVNSTSCT